MSDQRILIYQVVLMENQGLTIPSCEVLNLWPPFCLPQGLSLSFYYCLETLDHWTKSREGLSEDPLTHPEEIWYIDASSFVLDGKRRVGYSVQFSRSVVSDSLQPPQSQDTRPPCPSPTPRLNPNSCPLSQ